MGVNSTWKTSYPDLILPFLLNRPPKKNTSILCGEMWAGGRTFKFRDNKRTISALEDLKTVTDFMGWSEAWIVRVDAMVVGCGAQNSWSLGFLHTQVAVFGAAQSTLRVMRTGLWLLLKGLSSGLGACTSKVHCCSHWRITWPNLSPQLSSYFISFVDRHGDMVMRWFMGWRGTRGNKYPHLDSDTWSLWGPEFFDSEDENDARDSREVAEDSNAEEEGDVENENLKNLGGEDGKEPLAWEMVYKQPENASTTCSR